MKIGRRRKEVLLLILIGIFFPAFLVSCGGGGGGEAGTPAPVADFTASSTTGPAPHNVTFTDNSTGTISSWSWDFGDGGTSTERNPTHNYATGGIYTVALTATGPGGSNTNTKAAHIKVTPSAQFTASPTTGIAPMTVAFTDQSTGGNNTSWSWDFGDDGLSSSQNPTHTYIDNGSYTVWLTVTGPGGVNTIMKEKIITVGPTPPAPVAEFTASPTTGPAPLNVTFTDRTTGVISTWSWDFGDGVTSAEQNPTHNYATGGTYAVSLTATGPGGSNTNTKAAHIKATPSAQFTVTPTTGNAPLTVAFTDQSTGGPITSWSWDFGDSVTSTEQNPSHVYAGGGSYTVSLAATGPGGSNTITKPNVITVGALPPAPVAGFSAVPTAGFIPLPVNFTDQSTGVISTWSWNFGDGGTSTERNPSHVYAAAGTYTVTLTATGPGGSNTDTKTNHITATVPVFTDNFNRADENPMGGNWTTGPGCSPLRITSNSVYGTIDNVINCAYWSANTFTADQYSQITITDVHTSKGPAVRMQTDGGQANYYYAKIDNVTEIAIKKNINGSYTTIGGKFIVPPLQASDTIRISVAGTTLELFVNGVSQGTRTDSDFSTGAPGLWHFYFDNRLDDWEGGSL